MHESGRYYSREELTFFGFPYVGENCKVSRLCSFYGIEGSLGNDVRIDDFCILKGKIHIGDHVHICAYSMLSGTRGKIILYDHSVLAARCSIYTGSNDHSSDHNLGAGCTGVPAKYTKEFHGGVTIGLAVMVGAHVVILPNTFVADGATIGAGVIIGNARVPEGRIVRSRGPGEGLWTMDRVRDVGKIRAQAAEIARGES